MKTFEGEGEMRNREELIKVLKRIDGLGYKAYIEGAYDFGGFSLIIDHVQGDPFASYDNPESKNRGE